MIDQLFDIMNSRNPLGKRFKAPLSMGNWEETLSFLKKAKGYLLSLAREDGIPLHRTKRLFLVLVAIMFIMLRSVF